MEIELIKVFLLTFFGYASLTSLRYGWSYSKAQINETFGVSMKTLGIVDAFYIMFYASGFVVLGSFAHKISLKNYVIAGLIGSSLCYMVFPILYTVA
jgi:sugar phosphate permease